MITTSFKALCMLIACSCLAACQEASNTVAPAPVPTVLPTQQTQQAVIDKLDAAQQVNQQRLDAAEKF